MANNTPPRHLSEWPHWEDGRIRVAGYDLEEIAAIAGQTPFYVYDRQLMTDRVTQLKAALPEQVKIHYAIKANPHPAVVNHMSRLVDGLDVASVKELRIALATETAREEISFAGPGKTHAEIKAAVAAGVVINAESLAQIHSALDAGTQLGKSPRLALRINPSFELKASGMKMTGGSKPFGIDSEQIPAIAEALRASGVKIEGLHLFCGSQNLKPDAIMEAHSLAVEHAIELCETHQFELRFVNIGGGLGIPYFPGEAPLTLQPIADNLERLIHTISDSLGKVETVMELGRYLVGESGLYVCRVIEMKHSRETQYAVVDGGLHQHLANSGNFGQVIRKNYPVEVQTKSLRSGKEHVTIVGPLCTPLDIVADKVELDCLAEGDLVVVRQSGAYGASASPQGFLSHPQVVELLL